MVEDDIYEFTAHITELVGAYPNQKFSEDNVQSYFRKLYRYQIETVLRVIAKASDEYPDRMPTAGQLASLCKMRDNDAVRITKEYLKRTFGDDYYEKDYVEGVRLGINRPVRDVLRDEVDRGLRDASELTRYDAKHGYGCGETLANSDISEGQGGSFGEWGPPPTAEVCNTPRCKALEEAWAGEAKGEFLSKEENRRRMNLLMKAFSEDHKEFGKKKIIDRMSREV